MPDRALLVLRTVVEACDDERDDRVQTSTVTQRLRGGIAPGRWVRVQLRMLHRRGYLRCSVDDEGTVSWTATEDGLALLKHQG